MKTTAIRKIFFIMTMLIVIFNLNTAFGKSNHFRYSSKQKLDLAKKLLQNKNELLRGKGGGATDVGGAGYAVVCLKGNKATFHLFDYYEQDIISKHTLEMGSKNLTYIQKIDYVLNRLSKIDPIRAKKLKKKALEVTNNIDQYLVEDIYFQEVDDSNDRVRVGKNCAKVRFAWQTNSDDEDEKKYLIQKEIFLASPANVRAGIILHEINYNEDIKCRNAKYSDKARYYNFKISSSFMKNLTPKKYIKTAKKAFLTRRNCNTSVKIDKSIWMVKGLSLSEKSEKKVVSGDLAGGIIPDIFNPSSSYNDFERYNIIYPIQQKIIIPGGHININSKLEIKKLEGDLLQLYCISKKEEGNKGCELKLRNALVKDVVGIIIDENKFVKSIFTDTRVSNAKIILQVPYYKEIIGVLNRNTMERACYDTYIYFKHIQISDNTVINTYLHLTSLDLDIQTISNDRWKLEIGSIRAARATYEDEKLTIYCGLSKRCKLTTSSGTFNVNGNFGYNHNIDSVDLIKTDQKTKIGPLTLTKGTSILPFDDDDYYKILSLRNNEFPSVTIDGEAYVKITRKTDEIVMKIQNHFSYKGLITIKNEKILLQDVGQYIEISINSYGKIKITKNF